MPKEHCTMHTDALFATDRIYEEVGKIIFTRRTKLDWSQVQLAKISRLKVAVIRGIETGRPFSLETLSALLRVFEIDPRDILPDIRPREDLLSGMNSATSVPQLKKIMRQLPDYKRATQELKDTINGIATAFRLEEANIRPPTDHYLQSVVFTSGKREDLLETFGRRIQIFRTIRGSTASQIAQKSNVSLTSLCLIESGLRNPSLETVYRIAEGLDISVYYLIPGIHDNAQLLRSLDMTAWAISARSHLESISDIEFILDSLHDISNTKPE